jgi:hypothetical protein
MRMWPQMVDRMFRSFGIKAAAERMNTLHIDTEGHTPESKFCGDNIENSIPVITFHTMFCPFYVLDSRLHNAGSIGPPKMGTKIKHLCISLTLSVSRRKCCTCLQPIHWTCQPTVPCCL